MIPDFINMNTIWLFGVASFLLVITPGPAWLYIVSNTHRFGLKAGFASIFGLETGTLAHVAIGIFGISAVIAQSPIAIIVIKILGACFLLALGIQHLFQKTNGVGSPQPNSTKKIFLTGVILNVFNPKGILFFIAFLPQFITLNSNHVRYQIAFLGLLFIVIALLWGSVLTIFTQKIGILNNRKLNLRFLTSAVYIVIGLVSLFTSFINS